MTLGAHDCALWWALGYLSNKVPDERIPSLNEAFNDIVKRCLEYNTKLMSSWKVKVVLKSRKLNPSSWFQLNQKAYVTVYY